MQIRELAAEVGRPVMKGEWRPVAAMVARPNIKDIARLAGVSTATVSRALSDSGVVTEATRTKVHDAARALNYRLNVRARNLRIQKSMAVLLVVRNMANPFYLDIFKGVEGIARAAGYVVLMGNTEDDANREIEYFDMLRDGHVDGMILMTGNLPQEHQVLDDRFGSAPIVVALEAIENCGLAHVDIDNRAASRTAVRHLLDLGHISIGHIAGPVPEVLGQLRLDGFRMAMAEAGHAVPPCHEAIGDYSIQSGRRCCRRIFESETPPTALFVANDEMAFGAIGELRDMGLRVPQDVSVIGFDDLFVSDSFSPPLTTIRQPCIEIGRKTMTMLIDLMGPGRRSPEMCQMPTELIVRGSTAPLGHA